MNPNTDVDDEVALPEPVEREPEFTEKPTAAVPVERSKKPKDEDEIEIEIVDDTPEVDKGRAPAKEDTQKIAATVGDDAEDARFPADVQKRIKRLKFVYHEERRNKEKAEREVTAAVEYAKNLLEKNRVLESQLATGERVLIDQAQKRAGAMVENAKALYLAAHESGDAQAIVKASEAMSRAVSEHERLQAYQPQTPPPQQQPSQPQYQQPQQQYPAAVSERTQAWIKKNPWWQQPGYEPLSNLAYGVHQKLVAQGIVDGGDTADEYWDTINRELTTRFPEFFGKTQVAANGQASHDRTPSPAQNNRPRPVSPTAGGRTPNNGPIKVRLTQSQLEIARKLGLKPEQYAKQLVKEQRAAQ